MPRSFEGVRWGVFPDYRPVLEKARIEPRFAPTAEQHDETEMRSAGFSVAVPAPDGSEYQLNFPVTYFEARANRHKLQLIRSEKLASDAVLRYRLTAFLDDLEIARPRQQTIQLGSATVALRIGEAPSKLLACEPWDQPEENDLAVVLPKSLLEDAVEETRDHPEHEIGGCSTWRTSSGDLWVETGLVSAWNRGDHGDDGHFKPESFGLRDDCSARCEEIGGAYHSHPFRVCSACPRRCRPNVSRKFFFFTGRRLDDVDFAAVMLGLLWRGGDSPRRRPGPLRLYGWGQLSPEDPTYQQM
jgi:hypothetical protein